MSGQTNEEVSLVTHANHQTLRQPQEAFSLAALGEFSAKNQATVANYSPSIIDL